MATATATPSTFKAITVDELNALDRCDTGCGAAARAVATVKNKEGADIGQLIFCLHHAAKHADALESSGGAVERNDSPF